MVTQPPPQEVIDEFVIAAHGDFAKVKAMLAEQPALVLARAKWDESGIEAAVHTGQREVAEFLLAAGAALDICTAAMLGRVDQVKAFLDADPGQARAAGVHGIPVVFFPAIGGQREVVEILLSAGADVNAGEGGNTALHGAALRGHTDMAAWLLDRGADPNARDFHGRTPVTVAREAGHAALADLLDRRGRAP